MLNTLHYFHVIYVQAHFPNEPNKLWGTDLIVIQYRLYTQQKKLRKWCLRGYDKKAKTFIKDF